MDNFVPQPIIAQFLETSLASVEKHWSSGRLRKREIHCEHTGAHQAPTSSIFDIVEFALCSGDLPVVLSKANAAMWTFYLCELSTSSMWLTFSFEEKVEALLDEACDDGFGAYGISAHALEATVVVATAMALGESM